MNVVSREQLNSWAKRTAIGVAALIVVASLLVALLWNDRPLLSAIEWPPYPEYDSRADAVLRGRWNGRSVRTRASDRSDGERGNRHGGE